MRDLRCDYSCRLGHETEELEAGLCLGHRGRSDGGHGTAGHAANDSDWRRCASYRGGNGSCHH